MGSLLLVVLDCIVVDDTLLNSKVVNDVPRDPEVVNDILRDIGVVDPLHNENKYSVLQTNKVIYATILHS